MKDWIYFEVASIEQNDKKCAYFPTSLSLEIYSLLKIWNNKNSFMKCNSLKNAL